MDEQTSKQGVTNQEIGLRRGTVALLPYDPMWAKVFEHEKDLLTTVFGGSAVAIEHIGSTAVPGLSAKPIIDIEVGLRKFESWVAYIPALNAAGYAYMPERVRAEEVFMPKGPQERRTHYLHITEYGLDEWKRSLRFRDTLRTDERMRSEYAALKTELARRFSDNRAAYSAAKSAFITRSFSI